jgi:hypothetical protein
MHITIRRELRILRWYVLVTSAIWGVLALAAFTRAGQRARFEEIGVERINVVEKDGRLRLVISNESHSPAPLDKGKPFLTAMAGTRPGLIFYNDEVTEAGGLVFDGARRADGRTSAYGHLSFDQYDQNQVVFLQYRDNNGARRMGLTVADRPDASFARYFMVRDSLLALPASPARDSAVRRWRRERVGDTESTLRVFVGRDTAKVARLALADGRGRPHLTLSVDSAGAARIDFLDEGGRIVHTITEPRRTQPVGRGS